MRRNVSRREWLLSVGAASTACAFAASEEKMKEDDGMVVIPAGPFLMGTPRDQAEQLARKHGYHVSWFDGEVPQRKVKLAAFKIDRFPVTNRQFLAFRKATGYGARQHWNGPEPPAELLDHPVVFVNKADAMAYAQWAGKRLPTEAEWEKAARGDDGRLYPWGNEFDAEACHFDPGGTNTGTAPVMAHPKGASPHGVMDMAGNVGEWCADSPGPGSAFIKGGCWLTTLPINLRAASRLMSGFDNNASAFYGFRCAKDLA